MKKLFISLILISLNAAVIGAGADIVKIIEDLIPRLASTNVPERYSAQMELQKMVLNAGRPGAESERVFMAKTLAVKAIDDSVPQTARVWFVRQLEYIGGDETVDALQKILAGNDAELRECARRALEKNPSSRAVAILRKQLSIEKEDIMKLGLIHSLGERRDKESVALISPYLKDPKLGSFSAIALGKVATTEAINTLLNVLNVTPSADEALIEAGNRLLAAGNKKDAKQVFQQLYTKSKVIPIRGAALEGLGKADPEGSYKIISEALETSDEKLQILAVNAIKQSYDNYSTRLMASFPKTGQATKVAILAVVDKSVEQQVINVLKDEPPTIRIIALRTLGRIGGAHSVSVLLKYATEGTSEERNTAENALTSIAGKDVEKELENFALKGDSKLRVSAINAIGARSQKNSAAVIIKAISDPDPSIRKAAFSTIGKIGTDSEFEQLVNIAIKEKSKEAISALEQIARRVKDKTTCGQKLVSTIGTDENTVITFLGVLSAIGTDECLKPIGSLLQNKDASIKLSAIQAMSEWQNLTAAKYLLQVLNDPNTPKNAYTIALRGITGIVSSVEDSTPEKTEIIIQAFKSTQSETDKKLVISATANIPDPRIAELLIPLLNDTQFRLEAGQAAINVAEALAKTDKNTALQLANAIQKANITPELNKRAARIK